MNSQTIEDAAKYGKEVEYYLQRIIEKMNPEKVILYGSKAKGTADQYSDTDFAVITDGFADTTEIYGAVDIVNMNRVSDELKEIILNEGVVLYERKS